MPNYIRPQITGASIFFTVALHERGGQVLVDHVARLREAVAVTKAERPFGIDAWVVLPDHLHCVWTLPGGDGDFFDPLAVDQGPFLARPAPGKPAEQSSNPAGARDLAATLLGASHPRSGRHGRPCDLLLDQSGQARTGGAAAGLAVLLCASGLAVGCVISRTGVESDVDNARDHAPSIPRQMTIVDLDLTHAR